MEGEANMWFDVEIINEWREGGREGGSKKQICDLMVEE